MPSPELIRRASAEKASRKPFRPTEEIRREESELLEVARMFREMRRDCEELLNTRGVIKRHPLATPITLLPPFDRGRVLETSIPDDEGKPIKVELFSINSLNKDPVKSLEINLLIEGLHPFLSFQEDDRASIDKFTHDGRVSVDREKRDANIHDARSYREIVDALQSQQ